MYQIQPSKTYMLQVTGWVIIFSQRNCGQFNKKGLLPDSKILILAIELSDFPYRELMLVADALRLGGAILSVYPDMLAPQLVGRLLPEIGTNKNIKNLLVACDASGSDHCALIPLYHCLHTPGGPLKVSSN